MGLYLTFLTVKRIEVLAELQEVAAKVLFLKFGK
jgi:hypothetical protein